LRYFNGNRASGPVALTSTGLREQLPGRGYHWTSRAKCITLITDIEPVPNAIRHPPAIQSHGKLRD
jgi:hypothetical protein